MSGRIDGPMTDAGCRCGAACEFPCWQRAGLVPEGDERCSACGCEDPEPRAPRNTPTPDPAEEG